MNRRSWLLAFGSVLVSTSLFAADPAAKPAAPKKPEPPAYLTPETAGPDFAVQGEYAADGLGAQVIALGDGAFRAVLFLGGLPGAGWDGGAKTEIDGRTQGGKTVFTGDWTAEIAAGQLSVKSDKGASFALKRLVRHSPTEGAKPPAGALVLFDGTGADAWAGGALDERQFLKCATRTKRAFRDFTLHLEFLLPFKPLGRGQGRGNSGVYLQDRYEVQVLDSFGLKGLDNECGGLYRQATPKLNMCLPPLQWQTYDIEFQAPRFDAKGAKTKSARISVRLNGVPIHEDQELTKQTGGGKPESPEPGPIQLQGHANPVVFRNIWVVEKESP